MITLKGDYDGFGVTVFWVILKKILKIRRFFSIGWTRSFVMLEKTPSGNFLKLFVVVGTVY